MTSMRLKEVTCNTLRKYLTNGKGIWVVKASVHMKRKETQKKSHTVQNKRLCSFVCAGA